MSCERRRIMRKALKIFSTVFLLLFAVAQFVRPARTNPPVIAGHSLEENVVVTQEAAAVLGRSCADCHSNKTAWPWYSNVAPVSWFVVNDVNEGRHNLNLSEWGKLDRDRQDRKLRQICDEVQD